MNINKLLSKPYLFHRIATLTIDEFMTLADKLHPEWQQREKERLMGRKDRINALGQGRPYQLGSFNNLLLCTIIYLRTNIGYEMLSILFDVDPATIKRVIKRVVPLLQDRFIPKTELSKRKKRINTLDELIEQYPGIEDVIFDGTEVAIKRPTKRQKQSYSGKKKRHTKKFQLAQDKKHKLILGLSPPAKGKVHDKRQLEQTGWNDKLPEDVNRWGDLAFLGMDEDINDVGSWIIPYKESKNYALTKEQKRVNKQIAKERVPVEHIIGKVKVFKRINGILSIKTDEWLYSLALAAVNLVNYKTLMRQGIN